MAQVSEYSNVHTSYFLDLFIFRIYRKTKRNEIFYREFISLPEQKGDIIIFISPGLEGLLNNGDPHNEIKLSMDGTFKVVPQHFYQLLTIQAFAFDHVMPLVIPFACIITLLLISNFVSHIVLPSCLCSNDNQTEGCIQGLISSSFGYI